MWQNVMCDLVWCDVMCWCDVVRCGLWKDCGNTAIVSPKTNMEWYDDIRKIRVEAAKKNASSKSTEQVKTFEQYITDIWSTR